MLACLCGGIVETFAALSIVSIAALVCKLLRACRIL
jgi:hypothetical protein